MWGDARINGKYDREMPLNCGAGKTLQSPLGSKEIKQVNLKGNQP